MISEAQILSCLEELFPIKAHPKSLAEATIEVELGWVAQHQSCALLKSDAQQQAVCLCLQLVVWERPIRQVRDIKEQEVIVARIPEGMPFERFASFMRGWAMALAELMSQDAHTFEALMPSELICPDALLLIKPKDEQDFKAACLTKSRLGGIASAAI